MQSYNAKASMLLLDNLDHYSVTSQISYKSVIKIAKK